MENAAMARVVVKARIANLSDLYKAAEGLLAPAQVRTIEIDDALIDTGASTLSLPARLVEQLGLRPFTKRHVRTASGPTVVTAYESVRLTVQGRDCTVDVLAIPDDCPTLIGQVPLELLDFVVDPNGQRLIGNPEHGGQQMLELFTFLPPQPPATPSE